jgi:hypothetical protein
VTDQEIPQRAAGLAAKIQAEDGIARGKKIIGQLE